MSHKHYNIGYLENTGEFLKKLKEHSYQAFTAFTEGLIVDLGCGTGLDAINLARITGTGVQVTGIDHDPELLNKARASASDLKNLQFILAEATQIPLGDETVSGLRAERLIQHLKEPELAITEIHRVLKKDHPLVILETLWDSLTFYTKHITIEKKINQYLTLHKVNSGWAANNLTGYLEDNNFQQMQLDVFPMIGKTLEEANQYLWIGYILKEMLDQDYLSKTEYNTFNHTLEAADKAGYFACSINLVMVSAVK